MQKTVSNGGLTGDMPNGTVRFLYEGERVIEEVASSSTTVQYVWGQYIDELIQMNTYASAGPQPLAAGNYYLLSDLLYRSVALTSATGAIVEVYDSDAYGNTLLFESPGADGTWFTNDDVATAYAACRYVSTGREYDAETQNYFYRARYYCQGLGRFLSRDPAGLGAGMNLYQFCNSYPCSTTDPSGLRLDLDTSYDGYNGSWRVHVWALEGDAPKGEKVTLWGEHLDLEYWPDPLKVCCKEIAIIQLLKVIDKDGRFGLQTLWKNSSFYFNRLTSNGWALDQAPFFNNPWPGYLDNGTVDPAGNHFSPGAAGAACAVPPKYVRFIDSPGWLKGDSEQTLLFETYAVCKSGEMGVLDGLSWSFSINKSKVTWGG